MSHSSGQLMQNEILRLVDYWAAELPEELVKRRRKVHSTVLALHQMQSGSGFINGCRTLFTDGAPLYLLGRPLARIFRSIRRKLQTPYWRQQPLADAELI